MNEGNFDRLGGIDPEGKTPSNELNDMGSIEPSLEPERGEFRTGEVVRYKNALYMIQLFPPNKRDTAFIVEKSAWDADPATTGTEVSLSSLEKVQDE